MLWTPPPPPPLQLLDKICIFNDSLTKLGFFLKILWQNSCLFGAIFWQSLPSPILWWSNYFFHILFTKLAFLCYPFTKHEFFSMVFWWKLYFFLWFYEKICAFHAILWWNLHFFWKILYKIFVFVTIFWWNQLFSCIFIDEICVFFCDLLL